MVQLSAYATHIKYPWSHHLEDGAPKLLVRAMNAPNPDTAMLVRGAVAP
jgi:hypothetical protein